VLLALAALLAIVAVASAAGTPPGSSETRQPSRELLDTIVSLLLVGAVLLAIAAALLYFGYLRTQTAEQLRKRRARRWQALIVLALLLAALVARFRVAPHQPRSSSGRPTLLPPARAPARAHTGYEPHFAATPVAIVLAAAGIAALAAILASRSRRREREPPELGPSLARSLADVLSETLDDLRAEPDPRKAVIAAYARLERALAAFGVPRRPSDAPEEYLQRILIDLEVGARHAARLTQLFEDAKFSSHEIGGEMKKESITLLELIRADLHAADAARAEAHAQAITAGLPA